MLKYDGQVKWLALRVNKTSKTWCYVGRINGGSASRHRIGEYPTMTLAQARVKALEWRALIAQGQDPTRAPRVALPFASVCEQYFDDMRRRGLRQAHEVEREVPLGWTGWGLFYGYSGFCRRDFYG
jgi:hypothetical protein